MPRKRILLTGAHGHVGAHVKQELETQGHEVVGLVRTPKDPGEARFQLGVPVERTVLAGADALIHAAYDFDAYSWGEIRRTNVEGSIELLRASHAVGVRRLIFVSTISAYEGCRSL